MVGSLGYADRLKRRKNLGGQLGAIEYYEAVQAVEAKAKELADLIVSSQEVFMFTGAGISTSTGIPDFRGPNGIWTLQKKKKPYTGTMVAFEHAMPTFTHMVIAALVASGKVKYVCSQNVDSLHLRSGVPRSCIAELHGNCFAERCEACKREYVRDFQVETVNFKPTGRRCTAPGCQGILKDNVLDWESPLPDDELEASIQAAERSGVTLVLGSSLQIVPANEIPLYTPVNGGKMVIVNLQKTPCDRKAALLVRCRVDPYLARLSLDMGLSVPPFVRLDGVAILHELLPMSVQQQQQQHSAGVAGEEDKLEQSANDQQQPQFCIHQRQGSRAAATGSGGAGASTQPQDPHSTEADWGFALAVHSVHGHGCCMPMVSAVTLTLAPGTPVVKGDQQPMHAGASSGSRTDSAPHWQPRITVVRCCTEFNTSQHNGSEQQQQQGDGISSNTHAGNPSTALAQAATSHDGAAATEQCSVRVPAPMQSGVPVGGPFEFLVTQVPASIQAVSCQVTLELAAPSGHISKHVTLPVHSVARGAVKGNEGCKTEVASGGGPIKQEEEMSDGGSKAHSSVPPHPPSSLDTQQGQNSAPSSAGAGWQVTMAARDADVDVALASAGLSLPCQAPEHVIAALKAKVEAKGEHQQQDSLAQQAQGTSEHPITSSNSSSRAIQQVEVVATAPGLSVVSFVSQAAWYDRQGIWDQYAGNPPEVNFPAGPPAKKAKVAAPPVDTSQLRRSGRRRAPSRAAREEEGFMSGSHAGKHSSGGREEGSEEEDDEGDGGGMSGGSSSD